MHSLLLSNVRDDLPKFPAKAGPDVARNLTRTCVPRIQEARALIQQEIAVAEAALLAALEAHEAKVSGQERLRAFAQAQKDSRRPAAGAVVNVGGGAR